jgi:hypothetical protein
VTLLNIKCLGMCKTPGHTLNLNGLQYDTRTNSPKDGDAAPRQILDVQLIQWFPLTQASFGHGSSAIGSFMKIYFQPYMERQNRTPYVAWASNLRQTAPGLRGGLEVKLYWASKCLGRPLLALPNSKLLFTHPLVLFFVPNQNITLGSNLFLRS